MYGGHLLALGTASIAASASFIIGKNPTVDLLAMAYLFSFGAYAVNRASDFNQDRESHPDRTAYLEGRRRALPAVAAGSFAVGYGLALFRNLYFFAGLLLPLVLAIAYSVGSKRMQSVLGFSRLKEGLLLKNVVVSFGWSLIPVLVGLYFLDVRASLLVFCPFIFLRLMVNTIFFDARDVGADEGHGVRTIPGALGLGRALRVMDVLDIGSALLILLLVLTSYLPVSAGLLAVFTPYSFAYRYYSLRSTQHRDSLRDFAADGEYALWGFVTYLGQV